MIKITNPNSGKSLMTDMPLEEVKKFTLGTILVVQYSPKDIEEFSKTHVPAKSTGKKDINFSANIRRNK